MATPKVYALCDANCRWETMTREQILTAIMQAVNEGSIGNVDAGFIQTVLTINNQELRFFYGEQSAYDALSDAQKQGTYAIITNDGFRDGVESAIKALQEDVESLQAQQTILGEKIDNTVDRIKDGSIIAEKAQEATTARTLKSYLKSNNITERGLYLVNFKVTEESGDIINGSSIISIDDVDEDSQAPISMVAGPITIYEVHVDFFATSKTISVYIMSGSGTSGTAALHSIRKLADYVL